VFAAAAATREELEEARKKMKLEKSKPIEPDRRIWRPQVASKYMEPDCIPDPLSDLEILYKEYGKPLWANKSQLPPRDDLITFDPAKHQTELDKNLVWGDCPTEKQPVIKTLIMEYWDVFAEEGVRKNIRGIQFHVDTGEIPPICVKAPRYGPHETRVINDLVAKLEENGIIEDDDGPWGAPIVLAAKANQDHLHWSQYTWRLCVSYRKLNAVTRPFTFPIVRCDDAVKEIGDSSCFITMDLDSGYWQVACEPSSKPKLAFFTPTGKKRFTTMPMGATNAHPVFVALVAKFKKEWDLNARNLKLKGFYSQVIVDDIIISARDNDTLIAYFKCILGILQHYRCTAKLKKCRFLPSVAEFVGLDIHPNGNSPARSKFEAFKKLGPPNTFTDLNMLIGCFGFYQEHLPLYEVRIKRWRAIQKLRPPPGSPRRDEKTILESAWGKEDDDLLEELKGAILQEPILKRPDSSLRFYLKTDWSKMAMGAALLQPDRSPESSEAMNREINGEPCAFDHTLSGLRLHPVMFISRRTSDPEKSYHSYVGEACAGIWAIEKFRPYLFGKEFTWLTDCSGLRKFFEGDDIPTHMIQRWRMQLLRYDFTIEHRPGRMMFECDLLSRYNQDTEAWRTEQTSLQPTIPVAAALPIPFSHDTIKAVGTIRRSTSNTPSSTPTRKRMRKDSQNLEATQEQEILESCDLRRSVWIIGARMNVVTEAFEGLGIDVSLIATIEENAVWRERMHGLTWEEALELADKTDLSPDWIIIPAPMAEEEHLLELRSIMELLLWKGLAAVILCHNEATSPSSKAVSADWNKWIRDNLAEANWSMTPLRCNNADAGGAWDSTHRIYIMAPAAITTELRRKEPNLSSSDAGTMLKPVTIEELLQEEVLPLEILHTQEEKNVVQPDDGNPNRAKLIARASFGDGKLWPVFSELHTLPDPSLPETSGPRKSPLVLLSSNPGPTGIAEFPLNSLLRALGTREETRLRLEKENWDTQQVLEEAVTQTPKETLELVFLAIVCAESHVRSNHNLKQPGYLSEPLRDLMEVTRVSDTVPVLQTTIDRWTTIPLPTHRKWAEAVQQDRDLKLLLAALEEEAHLERHRFANKAYHAAWEKGQLEHQDGLIYHTGEPRLTQIRQLRRRVVPKSLRQTIITAYHATPLAGHSGIYRTYWRIAARYWWPRMYLDVKEAVGACAHCKLANAVGQESKSILDAISCDTPFDVIAIDIWSPGAVPDKYGNTKALTSLDTMTGFASAAILQEATSEAVARACFATFFVPNGLPKLVLIDAGSENKGELISMCQTLRIKYHMVAPEDHNGILCERFHRYLNKVQKIGAADSQTYTQWAQGVMFATYSWNAAPIDGTNIIRSFVAKGRVFPFPLQIDEDNNPVRVPPGQGEEALAHLETNFPLWARQSTMLQILVAERRERHRDLANQGRTVRKFNVGDLVIIRKQVQSSLEKGIPAKQKFKWKGIYKVVEKLGEKSYNVQKLPTVQGKGRPGRIRKYSAGVMEKIPSSLIINKHLDTSDTRLATLDQDLVNNPLEQSLGFFEFGKYVKAAPGADFAYDKVEDLWSINVESDEESDEEPQDTDTHDHTTSECNPRKLYDEILQSKDRTVIIKSQDDTTKKWEWYAAQVDWDETDETKAKSQGIYRLKWLIPHHLDSKKLRRRDCRYWPEIHEVNKKGDLGRMRFISPVKATRDYVEDQGWAFYEWDTDLTRDLLAGPFDLQVINNEPYRIPNNIWAQVKERGRQLKMDTSNIDRVVAIT
jgi:ribosomal protein L21E